MGSTKRTKTPRPTGNAAKPRPAPRRRNEHVPDLLSMSSDCYWEQDEHYRYTRITRGDFTKADFDEQDFLGTTRWDRGGVPVGDAGSWDNHQATLKARKPFTDFLFKQPVPGRELRYISTSGQPVFDEQGRFQGYRGIDKDVTERIQTELRLSLEHGVTRVLAESNSIADAAPQIISVICEALGWSCGARWVPDGQGDAIRCAETWGVASAEIDAFLESTRRQAPSTQLGGLNRRAWLYGDPLWIQDVTKEATFRRGSDALEAGLRSAFAFPIKVGTQSIGVMEFFSREIHQPDAELLNATRYIGSQIGQFMQRKQAEEALRESEERFRAVIDSANEGILVYDRSLQVISGNAVAERIIGLPLADIMGAAGFTSLLPCVRADGAPLRPEDRPTRMTIQSGSPLTGQILGIKRSDGSVTWLSVNTGFLRRHGESDYYGVVSTFGDITVQRQAAQALRESEERFRSLTNLSSDWFWGQDAEFRFTRMEGRHVTGDNSAFKSELGKTREELGTEVEGGWEAHHALLETHQPFRDVIMWRTFQDGQRHYMSVSGEPIFDTEDRFGGYRGVGKDITESRRGEQLLVLEHTVTRYLADADNVQAVLKAAIRAVCETEGWACGRCFRVDEKAGVLRFAEAWSASGELMDRFIEKSRKLAYAPGVGLIGRAWQSGQPIWSADITKDPRIHVEVARDTGMHGAFVFPVLSEGKTIAVLIFHSREVREPDARLMQTIGVIGSQIGQFVQRKRAEEDQRRFRAAMDASADLMLLIDPTRLRYIDVNDAACRALGYTREEFLAMGPQDIFSKSREEFAQLYERMLAGDVTAPVVEGVYRCKDGSQLVIEASLRAVRSAAGDMIVSIARDIRARKREEQLLALEHAVNRCLSEADSAAHALKSVIRTICESQSWECGRYFYADNQSGLLRFGEAWGVPDATIQNYIATSRDYTSPLDKGSKARAWRTGEPLWSQEISRQGHLVQSTLGSARDSFVFSVTSEGKPLGVLSFTSREVREPDDRLLQAVRVIGSQIGQFLQRKLGEEVLRDSEARFRSLTSLSSDWFWEQDAEFRFTRFEGRPGINSDETITGTDIIGKQHWETDAEIEDEAGWEGHRALLQAHQAYRDVVVRSPVLADGKRRYFSLSGEPIFDHTGRFTGYRGVTQEITERKQAEERIQYLATHDGLTALPNRAMFSQFLGLAINSAQRYQRQFAVLFLDLDRFKIINDTLGHDAGDTLLQEVSRRVKESLRSSDVVARLGGDEFVVLLQEVGDHEQIVTVARKLLSAVIQPVDVQGQECRVTASIGISVYPTDAQDEQTLMKNADMAMYLAKEQGKNNFQFYSKDIKMQSLERLALENSLRHALERDEFFLHYQAKLDLQTGAITGVETLLRWQHPDLGMVAPMQFIPLAEETGLIVPIGEWVLRTACAQNVAWQRAGLPPVCMAVNLSPRQFNDERLLGDVAAVLEETGMAPELLELEITESMVMGNIDQAAKQLRAIKQMGVRLAIDDFGTGYSSLAQIKRFPIDTIKVDRSFIRDIPLNAEDKAITEAIIAMGRSLSLTVVAEGVETEEQQTYLRDHACDEMQGFYFSKPVAPDLFAELLRTHVATPSSQQKELGSGGMAP